MKKLRAAKKRVSYSQMNPLLQVRARPRHWRDEVKWRHDRYRELVEQSNEGIWLFELDEPIDIRLPAEQQLNLMMEKAYLAECNRAMASMYGYANHSDLMGARLHQLLVPENEENRLYLQAFIHNNYRMVDVESVERDRHGNVLHFRNNLIGIVKDRWLIGAWGMQKDITKEVENREQLRRSEERLRMASDAGGVGLWEWNVATNELFWSDRAKHIFGFPLQGDRTMDDIRNAIHPDDRSHVQDLITAALKPSHGRFIADYRLLANGSIRWVHAFGEVFFDEQDQPLRMSGTVVDITDSKRAERIATQLRDVGSQLARAMTWHEVATIIKDFATQNLNAQAVALHRPSASPHNLELVLAHGYDEGARPQAQALSQPFFQQEPRSLSCIPVILNQDLLGIITLEYEQPQEFDSDFQRFVLTFADQCAQAFERARLYEKERSARQEAEAANKAKSKFLASMSHEIRTPLGAMIGFAELLNEEGISDEERRDCNARILRNGHLLADMINDILDLSKIESERLEVEQIDFAVIPLVQDVIGLLQLKAQEKNLRLILAAVGHLPEIVHSDPTRLRQILINLLGNAIKFTDKGRIEIRLSCDRNPDSGAQLRFTIVDTGTGIPESQQSRIFEPFLQADSSTTRRFGGTGLGLAVSRGLAQALGGDLHLVKSVVGEGSTFSFTINIGTTAPIAPASPSAPQRKGASAQELKGLHILVVDDNPDNRTYISSFLASAGAVIETAANGLQAVELAMQREFHIVLMDIQMPELDGFGALRYLRSQSYAKPILALTAHAMSGDRENSLNAGFQDHLVKPIDRAGLIEAIRKYTAAAHEAGS
ncbi:GAF domain-containing hybrid sensor histidine kinase/response regulator [Oligoflexus tunisiensis]|uniref:GAF domain-containing hybrid sensor histidine kinase/response regulator n=1 Tax=Oligoflexus tunisiensis TaxID=708132 RepID=UPI00159F1CA6|nr:GAF domain-containing hybrid sensor histidine kinase/response regulator [Oligoflexus tunisiensis]